MKAAPIQNKSALIDLARGLAALAVAGGHLRQFIFVDFGGVANPNLLVKIFYICTSLGHEAVIVFFVLSGFLIGRHVYEGFNSGRWSWTDYAIKRITRLWIVLLPALALTALWDNIGRYILHGAFYTGSLNAQFHSGPTGELAFGWQTFIMNALFLQTIAAPPFGSNGPLWSLANEFWYYLIFPLAFLSTRQSLSISTRTMTAVAATILCLTLPLPIVLYGFIWLMGFFVALFDIKIERKLPTMALKISVPVCLVTFLGLMVYSRTLKQDLFWIDLLCATAFCALLYLIIQIKIHTGPLSKTAGFFSEFSYTLYLTHFPFVALLASWLLHGERLQPYGSALGLYILIFFVTISYSFIIYLMFEKNTGAVQKSILTFARKNRAGNLAASL